MFSVKVIKDSINEQNQRLTTLELVYPRFLHCFDEETEVLAKVGNKGPRFMSFKQAHEQNALIAQVEPDKGNRITFVTPTAYVENTGIHNMVEFEGQRLSMCVTDEHRVLVYKRCHAKKPFQPRVWKAKELLGDYIRFNLPVAGICEEGQKYSKEELALMVWYASDGSRAGKKGYFHLKKDRKIQEVIKLLTKIGIPYKFAGYADGTCLISFIAPDWVDDCYTANGCKKLPEDALFMDNESYEFVKHAILSSGGSYRNKDFNSTSREYAEQVQILAHLHNERMNLHSYTQKKSHSLLYKSSFSKRPYVQFDRSQHNYKDAHTFTSKQLTGTVYCFTVPSSFLMVRRKGIVFISGNCEALRHRLFSRNVESSRAKPVQKNIEECMNNPVIPKHWTMNQAGMTGKECTDPELIQGLEISYKMLAYGSAQVAQKLVDCGLHKQVVNRILEPYIRTKELVTASEWENFLKLRTAPDAEPHMQDLANLIKTTLEESVPSLVRYGEWHLPYIEEKDEALIDEYLNEKNLNENYRLGIKQRVSAARCARISYKAYDGTTSIKKDLELFNKLYDFHHCFDKETEVLTKTGWKFLKDITYEDEIANIDENTGYFLGFNKPLDVIKSNYTGTMYSVDNSKISFRVTNQHRMFGHIVHTCKERYSSFTPKVFLPEDISNKSKKINIYRECRMTSTPIISSTLKKNDWGKLIGFYIGDGYILKSHVEFHLKKERKISYITKVLDNLGISYKVTATDIKGAVRVWFKNQQVLNYLETNCGVGSKNKTIGNIYDQETLLGVFDGLKNSDGSVKRHTWVYSTTSNKLKEDFLNKAPLVGISCSYKFYPKTNIYRFYCKTNSLVRINDSRCSDSFVKEQWVINEPVYCVTMSGGALVTRRHGHTLVTGNCSPLEHQATPLAENQPRTCNFIGWDQLRKQMPFDYYAG